MTRRRATSPIWVLAGGTMVAVGELFESPSPRSSASKTTCASIGTAIRLDDGDEVLPYPLSPARRMNEIDMQVEGDTDDEKAKALVRAMLEAGLAEKL